MGLGKTIGNNVETVIRAVTGKTDRIERNPLTRMVIVLVCLLVVAIAVLVQAWRYQGPASVFLSDKADRQTSSSDTFTGNRGTIFDSSGKRMLAATVRNTSVKTDGKSWSDDWLMVANSLAVIMEIPVEDVFRKIWDGIGSSMVIRGDIGPIEEAAIRRLSLPSISLITEESRFYPLDQIGGSLLGYVRPDEEINGKYIGALGVEESYDELLAGQVRTFPVGRDKDRHGFYEGAVGEGWNVDGADLTLTVDARLQIILDSALAAAVRAERAAGGMAVMMDPYTFEILAMSSYPLLNPNNYKEMCAESDKPDDGSNPCRNKVISYTFEPGSIAKIIGAAAMLESGLLTMGTAVNGNRGACRIGDNIVHDIHGVGVVSLREAVQRSSNCAMADGAKRVQPSVFRDTFVRFGIGATTGIDLPGESAGKIRQTWTPVDAQAGSYGYGYRTTLMTMAAAAATIANGGKRMEPRIVRAITLADGTVKTPERAAPVQIIKESTAAGLRDAMYAVVMEEHGTGGRAKPAHYSAAGKTGTARRPTPPDQDPGYNCSFVGYAPASNPRYVMAVTVLDPKVNQKGGSAAAPIFAKVADKALPLLGVKPDLPAAGDAPVGARTSQGDSPVVLNAVVSED